MAKFSWKNEKATNHIVPGKVMACCPMGRSSMIMVLKTFDNLDNIPVSKLRLIHLNMNSSNTANYAHTRLETPEQINTKDGYEVKGVDKNTLILVSPKEVIT